MNWLAITIAAPLIFAVLALFVVLVNNRRRPKAITSTQESTMTKKVQITNADTYPADVLVTGVNPTTGEPTNSQVHRLLPGQSCEVYVHSGQALRVEEVAQEAGGGAQTQGGGGPGEERGG